MTGRLRLAGDRATALARDAVRAQATCLMDERRLLMMLGLEPTPGRKRITRQRVVPPHDRHGRSTYTPGCRECAARNRAYIAAWRLRGGGRRAVTTRSRLRLVVIDAATGRGRRAAYPGQLALIVEEAR